MITLVIPTRNRSGFLGRLLRYYAEIGFRGRIIIGDSSDSDRLKAAEGILASVADRLDVKYRLCPGASNLHCARDLICQVSTPYAVWVSDDDFVVPRALDHAVDLLEARPEASAVHGEAVLLSVANGEPNGSVLGVSRYRQEALEHSRSSDRLLAYLSAYFPTAFSVHRTKNLQQAYDAVIESGLSDMFGELLPCCLQVIWGRVAKLDGLYMVRQVHSRMRSGWENPDVFDWIVRADWPQQFGRVRNLLATQLARQDGLDESEASQVVKQAFWAYLFGLLGEPQRSREAAATQTARWRARLRRVPTISNQYRKFQRLLPGAENALSLSALSHPSSPFYDDFAPIHRAIVNQVPAADSRAASAS